MNVDTGLEQRLIEVFQISTTRSPTDDLFDRVVHSIEEDRRHRRRVIRTTTATLACLLTLILAGALSMHDSPGRLQGFVDRPTMQLLEAIGLVTLLAALGPAIRRFGRGYAADLWPSGSYTPVGILRLMDAAFYLVGIGYILVTVRFEFGDSLANDRLAEQLWGASVRTGGLLLILGVLHAATFIALPLIALVDNSTRVDKPVPRWVMLLLVLFGLGGLWFAQAAVGFGVSMS